MKHLLLLLGIMAAVWAQPQPLKTEKSLHIGTLENGFAYTIVHNEKPKEKVEIRLLVGAGSLEETEDQRGFAHFVEHMAFNGSHHFAKNDLVSYFESIGMRFGGDLNAETNFEWTEYKLSIPLEKDHFDKSLTIVRDWADGLSFKPKAFEDERGVILSELRMRDSVGLRLWKASVPLYFGDSRYAKRLTQGDKAVLRHGTLARAKAFYDTWYRPDLMHLVIVGDVDVNRTEALIKEKFASLKSKVETPLTGRTIAEDNTTRIFSLTDKELTGNLLSIIYRLPAHGMRTEADKRRSLTEQLMLLLFGLHAEEYAQRPDPKAQEITFSRSNDAATRRSIEFSASYRNGEGIAALKALDGLLESFATYGFSEADLALTKKKVRAEVEKAHAQLSNLRSEQIAQGVVTALKYGNVYLDYDYDYRLTLKMLDSITLAEVNKAFQTLVQTPDRSIRFIDATGKKYAKDTVMQVLKQAIKEAKDLSKDRKLPKKLLPQPPKAGKIVQHSYDKQFGIHHYRLENNITVDFKPTRFTKGKVLMEAWSPGGTSVVSDADFVQLRHAVEWIERSGAGEYTVPQLQRILANKSFRLTTYIERFGEGLKAQSDSSDLESMFELLYLKLTAPRLDKTLFENAKKQTEAYLAQAERNPDYRFAKALVAFYYFNNPRLRPESKDELAQLYPAKMLAAYKARFADMNHFHFVIVGDATPEQVESLLTRYLANLPTQSRKESYKAEPFPYKKGEQTFTKALGNEPRTKVTLRYHADIAYSPKTKLTLDALTNILQIRLRNTIREKRSGVYAIEMGDEMIRELQKDASLEIRFDTAPKRADELIAATLKEIDRLRSEGVSNTELEAYKRQIGVMYKSAKVDNAFWLTMMMDHHRYGLPLELITDLEKLTGSITTEDIKEMAGQIFGSDRLIAELKPVKR